MSKLSAKLPDRIFILAAFLDPNWGARWLEHISSPTNLSQLKTRVKGNISVNEHIIRHFLFTLGVNFPMLNLRIFLMIVDQNSEL